MWPIRKTFLLRQIWTADTAPEIDLLQNSELERLIWSDFLDDCIRIVFVLKMHIHKHFYCNWNFANIFNLFFWIFEDFTRDKCFYIQGDYILYSII